MKRVTIVGVGLIGGSIALSLKKAVNCTITGFDLRESQLRLAETLGVVDYGAESLQEAVREADCVFLCAPVGQLYDLIRTLSQLELKEGAIITDTGSTKARIVDYSVRLKEQPVYFIGGHPMAGSHKSGVEAAHDRLFENAYYVLTPTDDTPTEAVDELRSLLAATKAKIVLMDPVEHDQIVGAISHFPHIIASLLVNLVARYSEENDWYYRLAAGGFRDITRIASSNPVMWRDILLNNQEVIEKLAADWQRALEEIVSLVARGKEEEIERFFREARDFRDRIPERRRGALTSLYDLFLDVPDHPGVIGKVTTLLGEAEISIVNIQILEIREDIMGVLRITFRNEEDLDRAAVLLRQHGYHVYPRD
ncbi:prephenate dehydrogenase [Bacillaceae bacterium]